MEEKLLCNGKVKYEKPKYKLVKPIFSNSYTTTYDATSHKYEKVVKDSSPK